MDGFNAAVLIEDAGLVPQMGISDMPTAGGVPTLDIALRQVEQTAPTDDAVLDREARREATALDLWINSPGGCNFRPLRIGAGAFTDLLVGNLETLSIGQSAPGESDSIFGALLMIGDKIVALRTAGTDEPDGGEITVVGTRDPMAGLGAACVRYFTPSTVSEGGPGDGGGSIEPNPPEYEDAQDADCPDGAAEHIGDKINQLVDSVGRYEFGAAIVRGADNRYGAYQDGIHTDYSLTYAHLPFPEDVTTIVGVIHNHPYNPNDHFANLNNRYPSSDDWIALDSFVAAGADPSHLSIYITDPWGVTREFSYSDKATYQHLTDHDRQTNICLPAETHPCNAN